MDGNLPVYEAFAIKYAEVTGRPATDIAMGVE